MQTSRNPVTRCFSTTFRYRLAFGYNLMNLVFRSLLCATIGWAVSLSVIIFGAVKSHFEAHPPAPGELAGNVAVFAVAMAVFILPTWILILLPLFLFTKKESFIWNYFFCPFLGIFIACSIIYIFGRINSPQADPKPILILAAIAGGSTGIVAAFSRHRELPKAEQGAAANP